MEEISKDPIVIIGGGPGGYKSALELRKLLPQQKIVLIEKSKLGGACLHVGCIPSKLLHSIKSLDDYPKLIKKNKTILEKAIASELKSANIEIIVGEAILEINKSSSDTNTNNISENNLSKENPKTSSTQKQNITVKVQNQSINASHLIIATGSKPKTLKDFPNALNSDSFFAEENLNKGFSDKYCFIGGGYIGVELASMLAHHGKKVRIVEMLDSILNFLDPFIKEKLLEELKRSGIEVLTGIKNLSDAKIQDGETIFVSVGREIAIPKISNSNEDLKTLAANSKNIHIIGDASNEIALAHYAYAQARKIAYKIANKDFAQIENSKVPLVIFSHPEIGTIGLNETEAKNKFGADKVETITIPWASNGKARIIGHERGFTKWTISKDSEKILGCSIIGEGATDLISIVVPIINMAPTISDMRSWIYPHPTLGEIFAF